MSRRWVPGNALHVIPAVTATTLGLVLQLTSSWRFVGIGWLDPTRSFEDMWQVTATADCVAADPSWSPATATCDPWERPYNYPLVWARTFAHLGWGRSDTQWLGMATIVVFGLTLLALALLTVRRAPLGAVIALTVSAASPPALMAMERGNIDLLVWPWVVLALWLMASDRWSYAVPVIATAVFLKIFPLGLLAAAFGRRRGRVLWIVVAAGLCLLALAAEADQLPVIRRTTPQVPLHSWGVAVLPIAASWGSNPSIPPYALGLALLAACVLLGTLVLRLRGAGRIADLLEGIRNAVWEDRVSRVVVSAGLGLVLFTYALGTNFDYRLLVVTILVAGLARTWANPGCRRLVMVLVGLQLISHTLTYPWELLTDVLWFAVVPAMAVLACWLWIPALREWARAGRAPIADTVPKQVVLAAE